MDIQGVSAAVKSVVSAWLEARTPEAAEAEFAAPLVFGQYLAGLVRAELTPEQLGNPKETLQQAAFLKFEKVFESADLPVTPEAFHPIPGCGGTIRSRATAITIICLLELEPISYGSENEGELFVNLVTLPGEGAVAEKSRKNMHGHTDAVSFPTRGLISEQFPKVAPSPDAVCLAALRNPDAVPTTVMRLATLLDALSPAQILELKQAQFLVRSQKTFVSGTKRILGEELVASDVEILLDTAEGTWIRYSHSSVGSIDDTSEAALAVQALEAACVQAKLEVALAPGDILVVSNRTALHGRATVGGDPGGESRWLLRTYGLDTGQVGEDQRYANSPHMLFP